ncbi:serine/threonine-protein kinase [Streptomyces orinoci]|uniref:Protein kinase n=1 Tax=Streptomyces orinoci TaxID=67339 RepID=A0ABV3K5A3_STRON|nr:serine/threonine-protein kinase [Streptomyces orinoci]
MEALSPDDPRTLGGYRLLGRLGAGGMGRVYLARSDRGRTVAVKLVRPELAGQEEFRRRFRQEVSAARQVGGEWTAPVLDADTEAEIPWVATGYIAGPSLTQVVEEYGPLPERSVRILAAALARALESVHAAGLVHRDLKPSNVLITLDGPRVIDFGIARALDAVTGSGLTRTGAPVGSPGFMSPEQVRGRPVTPASDIFCLGSVLAFAATGLSPFGTADSGVHALMFRIAEEEPDLDRVPESLRPLVASMLAKDPDRRPTPGQLLERPGSREALDGLRGGDPWLPGALVAQLGRHAAQLLELEEPGAPVPPSEAPTQVGHPAQPPTMTAAPPVAPVWHPPTVVHQPPPAQERPRRSYLLVAIAVLGVLAGAGTVYLLRHHGTTQAAPSPSPTVSATVSPTHGTTPTQSATPVTGTAQDFLGVWQSGFDTHGGHSSRTITIGQDTARIQGSGFLDDGTAYTCAWSATVNGGGTGGTPLHLGPSSVVQASPASACQPGSPSDLVLLPDGRMRRDFTDTGTKDASLVYRRAG